MKNFKLNRKGFTLIELLAVITILGILMLILIPSVSRIIENSRKNTFLSTAKNYANAVRDEWAADNLYCSSTGSGAVTNKLASSLNTGTFYVYVQSEAVAASGTHQLPGTYSNGTANGAYNNFTQLINSGGRSSWGNNEVYGYVKISVHPAGTTSVTGDTQMAYDYYVELIDSAGHGLKDSNKMVGDLIRSDVATTGATATAPAAVNTGDKIYSCIVS